MSDESGVPATNDSIDIGLTASVRLRPRDLLRRRNTMPITRTMRIARAALAAAITQTGIRWLKILTEASLLLAFEVGVEVATDGGVYNGVGRALG